MMRIFCLKRQIMLASMMLLLCSSILTGCGFIDIDKRFFVMAVGFDKTDSEDKPFLLTLKLAVPSPQPQVGKLQSQQIISIKTRDIAEGLRMLKSSVDKELDYSHCKVILIGEDVVKEDITPIIEWATRRRDIQLVADIAIARPKASDIITINIISEQYAGNALLLTFAKDGTESSYITSEHISDIMRRHTELGMDPYLPIIEKSQGGYIVNKTAFLDKKKLKLVINPAETQLYNQIDLDYSKSIIRTEDKGKPIVLALSDISSSYKINEKQDPPTLTMKIRIDGSIEEGPIGIFDENWGKIENLFEVEVKKQAEALFVKIQKAGVDPLGFGLHYRATHRAGEATWKNWQRIYPQLKFKVIPEVSIEGTGSLK